MGNLYCRTSAPARRAFTLVEILIVVVILGILAAMVVPKLSNASAVAREATLKDDCRFLRTQIIVYTTQHHDVAPGYLNGNTAATPTTDDFIAQLTLFTDDVGHTSTTNAAPYQYGPYLTRMPDNPLNALVTIKIDTGTAALTPDGTTGWLYQPATGTIIPNLVGVDSGGKVFATY